MLRDRDAARGIVLFLVAPAATLGADVAAGTTVSTTSGYFIVHCWIHSANVNLRMDTLIARYGIGFFI